jgi:hypothetical protein
MSNKRLVSISDDVTGTFLLVAIALIGAGLVGVLILYV